jgi:hypothetical protein
MRIALIFTGVPRLPIGSTEKVIKSFQDVFPTADSYFHTWEHLVDKVPAENVMSCPQPEIEYHPLVDTDPSPITNPRYFEKVAEAKRKHAKGLNPAPKYGMAHMQICGYADAVSKVPKDYDVYIKTRYDLFVSKVVDFKPYLKRAITEGPVGFSGGAPGRSQFVRGPCFDEFREQPKLQMDDRWKDHMLDLMIFHRGDHFDSNDVKTQFDNHQLKPGEFGWWSVMSAPYGGDIHTGVWGGVRHWR